MLLDLWPQLEQAPAVSGGGSPVALLSRPNQHVLADQRRSRRQEDELVLALLGAFSE